MARKVSMREVSDQDGESGLRAVDEGQTEVKQPEPTASDDLDVLSAYIAQHSTEREPDLLLKKPHSFNRIRLETIKELAQRKAAGKLNLSDGHKELLKLERNRLGL